jgi:HEPN domain-containing protein
MTGRDPLTDVVREWIGKAENDLLAGSHTLKLKSDCPTDTVCFHAQQCAEKYIKGLLVFRRVHFPRTHDLSKLYELWLPPRPELEIAELDRLTAYAVDMRYPEADPITLAEARSAIGFAREIRRAVRQLLPRSATKK